MEGNQFDDVGVVEPQIDPKELKAQRKEKSRKEKEKRKAYNKRMKERRKTSQVLLTNDV